MAGISTLVHSSRVYVLFGTVPYALLWMREPSSGGVLMVLAHSLLVLFYMLTLDRQVLASGQDPVFALAPDRGARSVDLVDRLHSLVGMVLGVVALLLLVASIWAGVVAIAGAVLIILLVGGRDQRSLRWRLRLAEFVWPGAMLIGPGLLIRAYAGIGGAADAEAPGAAHGDAVMGATVLGGAMLGVFVLLTLMRDARRHRALGYETTPAVLGPTGALVVLCAWLMVLALVGIKGVDEAWWSWQVAGACAWLGVIAGACAGAGRASAAVGAWCFGQFVVGFLLLRDVG